MINKHQSFNSSILGQKLVKVSKITNMQKPQKSIKVSPLQIEKTNIEGNKFNMDSKLMVNAETNNLLILVFYRQDYYTSEIKLYRMFKQNGGYTKIDIKPIHQTITVMCLTTALWQQKDISQQCFILLMGTQIGSIKIIPLLSNTKLQIDSFRIQTKSIVDIKTFQKYNQKCICFILTNDNKILLINFNLKIILIQLKPTIMNCQKALQLNINNNQQSILQVTKDGYLIFWNIIEIMQKIQNNNNNNTKFFGVLPILIIHIGCSIKCARLGGNLIYLITTQGILKILSIDFNYIGQFGCILQYQIPNGNMISWVHMNILQQYILICINHNNCKSIGQNNIICKIKLNCSLEIQYIRKISVFDMNDFDQVWLSNDQTFIIIKSSSAFLISCTQAIIKKGFQAGNIL